VVDNLLFVHMIVTDGPFFISPAGGKPSSSRSWWCRRTQT